MRQRKLKNEINVVPYIDVMLVLLVIFMVATPMMTTGSVNLPTSGTAPGKPDKFIRVEIDASGALTVTDPKGKSSKVSGNKELRAKLAALDDAEEDEIAILIAGDQDASYKSVMNTLEEVKRAGFQKVGLETASK